MEIKILGGHGGLARGFSTTSFLINDELLIDAGSVASTLSVEEQSKINHILISHSHLDHIKDLAFICDNCFGLRKTPFQVFTHATVKRIIKEHLFNETIWPDFTILPNEKNPTMQINAIEPEVPFKIKDYTITPVKVQHPNDAMGYIIEKGDCAILFTVDTASTDRIWQLAHEIKNLKAIFTEVSFPNALKHVAIASDHHTASSLKVELSKMPSEIPVILTHIKPNYRDVILKEISELQEKRLRVLEKDGEIFNF
jgi:ribonuclease BN (tRNA processing enzyme)